MANTTNYGWETPDDTDYVYQGAAAARTTANSIDTTVYSLPQGTKSYVRDAAANLTITTAETAFFTSPSFTPVAGRLYLITYTVGSIFKITNTGDVYVKLRANNVAGFLIDQAYVAGMSPGTSGQSLTKTIVATSAILGTTAFVPCVTVQSTTSGLVAQNIVLAGAISITDIGPS